MSRGSRVVLAGVDLTVSAGDRIAVVGPNGVGKTTLLRVLAGELNPGSGSVGRHPGAATVVHFPQEAGALPEETIVGYLARRTGVGIAEAALRNATAALAEGAPGAEDGYSAALDGWLALGGADLPEAEREGRAGVMREATVARPLVSLCWIEMRLPAESRASTKLQ